MPSRNKRSRSLRRSVFAARWRSVRLDERGATSTVLEAAVSVESRAEDIADAEELASLLDEEWILE